MKGIYQMMKERKAYKELFEIADAEKRKEISDLIGGAHLETMQYNGFCSEPMRGLLDEYDRYVRGKNLPHNRFELVENIVIYSEKAKRLSPLLVSIFGCANSRQVIKEAAGAIPGIKQPDPSVPLDHWIFELRNGYKIYQTLNPGNSLKFEEYLSLFGEVTKQKDQNFGGVIRTLDSRYGLWWLDVDEDFTRRRRRSLGII